MAEFTLNDVKKMVRNELQCPNEFIKHWTGSKEFDDLKQAIISDDRDIVEDIMDMIRTEYMEYCKSCKLDPSEDNTNAKPYFFLT